MGLPLEEAKISEQTCRDFVYFRQLLASSRGHYDDNINHRINDIDTSDSRQCRRLNDSIEAIHRNRRSKLNYCIKVLKQNLINDPSSSILAKEVLLLYTPLIE